MLASNWLLLRISERPGSEATAARLPPSTHPHANAHSTQWLQGGSTRDRLSPTFWAHIIVLAVQQADKLSLPEYGSAHHTRYLVRTWGPKRETPTRPDAPRWWVCDSTICQGLAVCNCGRFSATLSPSKSANPSIGHHLSASRHFEGAIIPARLSIISHALTGSVTARGLPTL